MIEEPKSTSCPLCRNNQLLKSEVIAESDNAYLIENFRFPGNYLIIPNEHIDSPLALADTWWRDVRTLLPKVPGQLTDYNLTFNIGKPAGQTIEHLHLWVIPRAADQKNSGKGLHTLLSER